MKTLIIGAGEVGQAIYEIVNKFHETYLRDFENLDMENVEILHVCYPDSDRFVEITKKYIAKYQPRLTIINSSVRVGTTDLLNKDVVYSPVRGRHPNLSEEMKFFIKFVAGHDLDDVRLAELYFIECGLTVAIDFNPVNLELSKLLSNIHMGVEIAWRQEVDRILKKFGADRDVYELWEKTYADGYENLNQTHLMRPLMRPHPIGGHCILECTEILKKQYKSPILDFVIDSNDKAKQEKSDKKMFSVI